MRLGDPAEWDWVEPFSPPQGKPLEVPPDLARRHLKWARIRSNTHAPAHREIMLTIRGEAVYSIDDRIYYRRPGTVILLERHQTRDLKGSRNKVNFTCLWIHLFSSSYLTYYINGCNEKGRYTHLLPMRSRSGETPRLIMEAWDQCQKHPEDRLARGLLRSLITATQLEILGQGGGETPEDHHEQVVQSVKEYIRQHLAEDLSLATLANVAGYSPFFFPSPLSAAHRANPRAICQRGAAGTGGQTAGCQLYRGRDGGSGGVFVGLVFPPVFPEAFPAYAPGVGKPVFAPVAEQKVGVRFCLANTAP